jgi:hypothetical protein
VSSREMKKRKRLTPSLASGRVFEEGRRQEEMATVAEAIDRLRASAESTVAGREPNRKLRLLVLDDDGFAPHHAALF